MRAEWEKKTETFRNSILHVDVDAVQLSELASNVPAIDDVYSHESFFKKLKDAVNISDLVRSPRSGKMLPTAPKVFLDQDSNAQLLDIFSQFFDQFVPDETGCLDCQNPQDAPELLNEIFKSSMPPELLKIRMLGEDDALFTVGSLYRNTFSALSRGLKKDNVFSIDTGEPLRAIG